MFPSIPLGRIVHGLWSSPDNVFSIRYIISRWGMNVWVTLVQRRTVCGDIDWRFDKLSGHHWSLADIMKHKIAFRQLYVASNYVLIFPFNNIDYKSFFCFLFLHGLFGSNYFFLLQHKKHYLQNKTYTIYNTTYNTLLVLHYFLRLRF